MCFNLSEPHVEESVTLSKIKESCTTFLLFDSASLITATYNTESIRMSRLDGDLFKDMTGDDIQ
jgi:hypothetical protein